MRSSKVITKTTTSLLNGTFVMHSLVLKMNGLREGKESAPYLKDENLSMCLFDLFFAGTDTTQQTFQWFLLMLSYYPEIQKKLRQEIESEIGDRIPTHEDRNSMPLCHGFHRRDIENKKCDSEWCSPLCCRYF